METKPFPYQEEDVRKIEEFNLRALVAGEPGVGKTLESLLTCQDHPNLKPIVVVCPKSLKWNWAKEAKMHIGMKSTILESSPPSNKKVKFKHDLIILNYDILGKWLGILQSIKPKIVIGDEIHFIKSRGRVKRVRYFKQLCKDVPHILALSGTPMVNRPAELWNILNLLYPNEFDSWREFGDAYCDPQWTRWGLQYIGASNLEELHNRMLKCCLVRRLKSDVLKNLPPKSRYIVPLPIENPKEYRDAERDFIEWLKKQDPKKASRAKRAEKLVKIGYLKRLAAQLKLKSVFEWIDNYLEESEGKLILFCIHKKILGDIYKKYSKLAVFIDGSRNDEQRKDAVETFQKSKHCRIFIGNIQAAGTGLTLTASSTVVFIELDWTPGGMIQCEDRAHRIGQQNKVQIYYLIAHNTIEERLCEILQRKQKNLDTTLDGKKEEDISTLNVYDELELELKRTFGKHSK